MTRFRLAVAGVPGTPPAAGEAVLLAVGKMAIEAPVLNRLGMPVPPDAADDALWNQAAALFADGSRLDASSRGLMREKASAALGQQAMRAAVAKRKVEDPLLRATRTFEASLAKDTARNEFLFHRTLHAWLADHPAVALDAFNRRVYADLFLAPESDPWLGLVPVDTYAALDGEGLEVPVK